MGPAVYLTLTGRAREAVRDLKPADIGKETGLDEIIVKLDAVYLKDENTRAYVAFKEFYGKRSKDIKRIYLKFVITTDGWVTDSLEELIVIVSAFP